MGLTCSPKDVYLFVELRKRSHHREARMFARCKHEPIVQKHRPYNKTLFLGRSTKKEVCKVQAKILKPNKEPLKESFENEPQKEQP